MAEAFDASDFAPIKKISVDTPPVMNYTQEARTRQFRKDHATILDEFPAEFNNDDLKKELSDTLEASVQQDALKRLRWHIVQYVNISYATGKLGLVNKIQIEYNKYGGNINECTLHKLRLELTARGFGCEYSTEREYRAAGGKGKGVIMHLILN